MPAEIKAFFFLVAIVVWLIDALLHPRTTVGLTPLGLAIAFTPFFWDAADAGWFDD